eukprot:4385967-Pleurochrysis_carterae.AAC.1
MPDKHVGYRSLPKYRLGTDQHHWQGKAVSPSIRRAACSAARSPDAHAQPRAIYARPGAVRQMSDKAQDA